MTDMTEQLIDLQSRVQFQDDTIQKLDEVVIRQGDLLDRMGRKISELEDRLEQLIVEQNSAIPALLNDDKPPHY